jgi:hypothetical protein
MEHTKWKCLAPEIVWRHCLVASSKAGQNTDCNWVGSGERRTFKFVLKDHFLLGCYEYADYATSYDVLYPRTPCAHCNTQLDEQVNQWVEAL